MRRECRGHLLPKMLAPARVPIRRRCHRRRIDTESPQHHVAHIANPVCILHFVAGFLSFLIRQRNK